MRKFIAGLLTSLTVATVVALMVAGIEWCSGDDPTQRGDSLGLVAVAFCAAFLVSAIGCLTD